MSGKIIPKILIKELNEKKYKDLKEEFKIIIKQCFKSLNNDDTIKIKRLHTSNKGIFKLTVNKEFCYVYLLYKKDEIIYENHIAISTDLQISSELQPYEDSKDERLITTKITTKKQL